VRYYARTNAFRFRLWHVRNYTMVSYSQVPGLLTYAEVVRTGRMLSLYGFR
jgi:hypothetical protein